MNALPLRPALIQFTVVVTLVAFGALGIMVLLDPRAQAFWGARFSELGAGASEVALAVRSFIGALPYPGRP
ncbi:MAG: hypothetical protein EXR61_00700 [Chloroflexi bacterium]|nr:hypothetical protein [Chloroflexota bacterium]